MYKKMTGGITIDFKNIIRSMVLHLTRVGS